MANVEIFRNDPLVRVFACGERIFTVDEPGTTMYVVIEGHVELALGNGFVVAVAGPGEVFGEMALVEHKPRSATALARSDVRVAPIDGKRFAYLVRNTPYFAIEVMRTMAERLRAINVGVTG